MNYLQSAIGLIFIIALSWALSCNRKGINWLLVAGGLILQFALALIILKTQVGKQFFLAAQSFILALLELSDHGARFVFGEQLTQHPFAFQVLPTIIFVSSLSAVLFHLGILQQVIRGMAWVMKRIMNTSGSESLVAAANVFIGQTEAPLLIKPYLKSMTRSEILAMMCSGMATVAGGVLAAYVKFGVSAGHLLAASLMSAPAALVVAKILYPENEDSPTYGTIKLPVQRNHENILAAACAGAGDGLKLALNVAAMLIAFIALIELVNLALKHILFFTNQPITLQFIFGYLFAPFAWIMGVPWEECLDIGALLGEKIILNEFIAYTHLGTAIKQQALSERAIVIATYALCGFANFTSVGIQIGGIGSLEPKRRKDFAQLGLLALVGGNFAAFMTACFAGLLF